MQYTTLYIEGIMTKVAKINYLGGVGYIEVIQMDIHPYCKNPFHKFVVEILACKILGYYITLKA